MDRTSAQNRVLNAFAENHKWVLERYKRMGFINSNGVARNETCLSALNVAAQLTTAQIIAEQQPAFTELDLMEEE